MKAMQIMLQNSAQSIFAFFYKKNKKAGPRKKDARFYFISFARN